MQYRGFSLDVVKLEVSKVSHAGGIAVLDKRLM